MAVSINSVAILIIYQNIKIKNLLISSSGAIMNQATIQHQLKTMLHIPTEADTTSNSKAKNPSYKIIIITI